MKPPGGSDCRAAAASRATSRNWGEAGGRDLATLEKLNAAAAARRAAILITDIATGDTRLAEERDDIAADPLGELLGVRFRSGASGMVNMPSGDNFFLTVRLPPPRLVVIGA